MQFLFLPSSLPAVILTLSSDEEEDDKRPPGVAGAAGNGAFSSLEVSHPKVPPEPISHKEPIITLKDDVPKEDASGGVTGEASGCCCLH